MEVDDVVARFRRDVAGQRGGQIDDVRSVAAEQILDLRRSDVERVYRRATLQRLEAGEGDRHRDRDVGVVVRHTQCPDADLVLALQHIVAAARRDAVDLRRIERDRVRSVGDQSGLQVGGQRRHDRREIQRVEARCVNDDVRSERAGEVVGIAVRAAVQSIVAIQPIERVVAVATDEAVGLVGARQHVRSITADQRHRTRECAAADRVCSGAAGQAGELDVAERIRAAPRLAG